MGRASIEYTAVARGYSSERDRINAAFEEYRQQPMAHHLRYADATQAGMPLAEIASLAYDHFEASQASTRGDPVLVIDYLQRLARAEDRALRQASSLGLGNDARQIATVYTERLRELACQLHCSVICLSAVSRSNGYTANTNMLGAAKESGDIEYTADVVMGLGPDEPGGNPFALPEPGAYAWILRLDKNRQGEATSGDQSLRLTWYPRFQMFLEREQLASVLDDDQDDSSANARYTRRRSR
ncbi:MAG TPA: DnaB-like helicase C-terminal domain-containing protein [Ktedonobacteraceae bacterium]|nr:DnaB-like helicase C-terminal domain-containing protein [Ktedonobacteraceae bacterium]